MEIVNHHHHPQVGARTGRHELFNICDAQINLPASIEKEEDDKLLISQKEFILYWWLWPCLITCKSDSFKSNTSVRMSLCFGYHRAVIHCVQRKKANTRGYLWPAVKSHHINVGSEDGFKGFSDKQE